MEFRVAFDLGKVEHLGYERCFPLKGIGFSDWLFFPLMAGRERAHRRSKTGNGSTHGL